MNFMISLALFLWIPFVLILFAMMKPHRAAIMGFVLAWMFLPEAGIALSGFPDYTKVSASAMAVLLGVFVFDSSTLFGFRLKLWDMPILMWCVSPFFSSVTNGLGVYDGLSGVLATTLPWGVPYFIGRLYLTNPAHMRDMAVIIFVATLVYLPLIWLELLISPQLHRILYGQHAHQFVHSIRWGGYRPRVFMKNGLILGLWMAGATVCGVYLWDSKNLKEVKGMPMSWLVGVMGMTFVFCKAAGALVLGMGTVGLYYSTIWVKTRAVMFAVLMVIPMYLASRVVLDWDAAPIVNTAKKVFNSDRVSSLEYRIFNENVLRDKAMEKPMFGWGGFGRSRVYNDEGEDVTTTDSAWIIVLGQNGLFGLISFFTALLLPLVRIAYHLKPMMWRHPMVAPTLALGMILGIFMIDRLLNAQINPIPMMIAGGLTVMPWPRMLAMIQMQSIAQQQKQMIEMTQMHMMRQ